MMLSLTDSMNGREQHIFMINIDYRGRHSKGIAIYNSALSQLTTKTCVSMNKNVVLNSSERLKQLKIFLITSFGVLFKTLF